MPAGASVRVLVGALLALGALFIAWFIEDANPAAALVVFALPPLLLAAARWRGYRGAAFWAGVLALVVVVASSWPGLRARFGRVRD